MRRGGTVRHRPQGNGGVAQQQTHMPNIHALACAFLKEGVRGGVWGGAWRRLASSGAGCGEPHCGRGTAAVATWHGGVGGRAWANPPQPPGTGTGAGSMVVLVLPPPLHGLLVQQAALPSTLALRRHSDIPVGSTAAAGPHHPTILRPSRSTQPQQGALGWPYIMLGADHIPYTMNRPGVQARTRGLLAGVSATPRQGRTRPSHMYAQCCIFGPRPSPVVAQHLVGAVARHLVEPVRVWGRPRGARTEGREGCAR